VCDIVVKRLLSHLLMSSCLTLLGPSQLVNKNIEWCRAVLAFCMPNFITRNHANLTNFVPRGLLYSRRPIKVNQSQSWHARLCLRFMLTCQVS